MLPVWNVDQSRNSRSGRAACHWRIWALFFAVRDLHCGFAVAHVSRWSHVRHGVVVVMAVANNLCMDGVGDRESCPLGSLGRTYHIGPLFAFVCVSVSGCLRTCNGSSATETDCIDLPRMADDLLHSPQKSSEFRKDSCGICRTQEKAQAGGTTSTRDV